MFQEIATVFTQYISVEDFQLVDDEKIDNSNKKRYFKLNYHQQGVNSVNPDQNVEFIFGEKDNFDQICNAYIQYEITDAIDGANQTDQVLIPGAVTGLVNKAFACRFKQTRLVTTGGHDIEHNKCVCQFQLL